MSHDEGAARAADARLISRMLFFSDAVFAIVLTLLALELRFPAIDDVSERAIRSALAGTEQFAAFLSSFALIGLWWLIHMRVTRKLAQFDWPTAICNLLCLACITLLPFASSVLGRHFASIVALQIYWTISAAAAFSMTLLFLVVTRGKGRLVGGMSRGEWLLRFTQSLAPGIAFTAGLYFAATGEAWLSRFSWALMFPIMAVGRLFHRRPKSPAV